MNAFHKDLVNLNTPQLEAVKSAAKQICIVAGPGTGKTKTLVAKICYLLTENKVAPSNILALTFTKKAAKEIEERILESVDKKQTNGLFIGTFHSFGMSILKELFGDNENADGIKILPEPERNELIRKLSIEEELKHELKEYTLKELSLAISNRKNSTDLHNADAPKAETHTIDKFFSMYNQTLAEKNVFDFDDLIRKAYELLKRSKELQTQLRAQYKYILIDEFQDTNALQYELIKQITTTETSLFVIGDPLQSIYAFRGARGDIFNKFMNDYPDTKQITLDTNYRSTKKIIDASHQLFPASLRLLPNVDDPGEVRIITTLSEYSEADWIVRNISELIGGLDLNQSTDIANDALRKGISKNLAFSDFAVIYRTHGMSHALERRFRESSIPFQKIGDSPIYLRPEIAGLIDGLRQLNENDAYKGKKLTLLANEIIKSQKCEEKLEGNPDRLVDLYSFINDMLRFDNFDNPLEEFIRFIEQIETEEYYDPSCDKVTLMTMHAAKGLEFKYVFICGFDEGYMPFDRAAQKGDIDEEKRLFYVAMTRAKQGLFITHVKERLGKRSIKISSFSELLTSPVIEYLQDERIAKIVKRRIKQKAKKSQMKMF